MVLVIFPRGKPEPDRLIVLLVSTRRASQLRLHQRTDKASELIEQVYCANRSASRAIRYSRKLSSENDPQNGLTLGGVSSRLTSTCLPALAGQFHRTADATHLPGGNR